MRGLGDLWAGRLPLAEAFWTHGVMFALALNMSATAGSMAAIAADLPGAVALGVHLLPVPYNLAIVVGVWRSATAHAGRLLWADLARGAVIAWVGLLTLA